MAAFSNLEKIVENYVSQLADETDAVRKSAFFKEYLDAMAKFWHYSYHNQILIHVQKRDASRVAGFRKWNDLGRRVKGGSKAIKILAPFSKKLIEKDKVTGEEKKVLRTYFIPVNVFDVSQTEGKELPKIDIEVTGDSHKEVLDKLLALCISKNIAVEFKDLGINGLYGYSQGGKIALDSKQEVNMQVCTLVHEIAHELLHQTPVGKKFSKQEKEIHAEATAYAVTKALGLENKSSAYLALYTADKDKILESLEIISKTVKQILGHFHGA
ncbi:MAG TPA: ArdC-like ssDNA-binding domain-containing protein [archaeon]|nr:ArdC-like ssDNA-binding domain-containing protein [archaeon]